MSMRQRLIVLVWLLAAAGAFAISTLWVIATQNGQLSAWALVAFVLTAAALAGVAHHLMPHNTRRRYLSQRRPLAGPRPGAQLPQ